MLNEALNRMDETKLEELGHEVVHAKEQLSAVRIKSCYVHLRATAR